MHDVVIRGEAIDARSDLFSLGSVLYAMCSGRPPFRAETALAVLRRISDTKARSIREINPNIPDWLEHVVVRLHDKSPDRRFQTAAEVVGLLEQCLAHVQQPTVNRLPEVLQQRPDRVRTLPTDTTWRLELSKRNGVLIGSAVLMVVTAVLILQRGAPRSTEPNVQRDASAVIATPSPSQAGSEWEAGADDVRQLLLNFNPLEEKVKRVWDRDPIALPLDSRRVPSPAIPQPESR